ncbi:4-alpha-glucanotransferase [Clostridium carboxidivorans P7]|uniref:4-alpha-glucanotransferase n=1 Tax=Clostridium carboxidivorans P7 TaxID=536227 RepID=C6PNN7_9CLOT|nr:4-alpha-glucanotransferase [Clostridium carboxidivorans]AKN32834.1 4-alpha-glucanotransferase [Clostridium carboxidivorans P7]EET89164.1 4-alpha-glucanotransferase [Clostridium carboxidivorans P7]EFG89922.1 4-alpha-glucanotransferase [Clostridium carboxidivorans P7]
MIKRSSGVLMHITSLPGSYGIGTFGKEAYKFVDFLEKSSQSYWQVLPLGITGAGDSPYQSFSAFAGNPYFIDLDFLTEQGLLRREDYENVDFGSNYTKVDYEKIFSNKMPILRLAFERSKGMYESEISRFRQDNKFWIEDYSLYMAIKCKFGLRSWQNWDRSIKLRNKETIDNYKEELKDEIDYWIFLQYLFFTQWFNLKKYANDKGIKIIGDIPIYVAEDSADTWANSEIFVLDEDKRPIVVSGCPPDAFSTTGQLWGNPIYNWLHLEKVNYKWWVERIKLNSILYDVTRVDHFRGFESFWEVPYGEKTAVNGKWVKGAGIKLFDTVKKALGEVDIIAEDLGYITQEVIDFRNASGFPGMKVLEFAFDTREQSNYLPHNYDKNCIVYTGTHDNETVMGWMENTKKEDVDFAKKYFKLDDEEGYNWGFIRGSLSSVANLAIAQFQDYLGLGNEARMNIPSTIGGNWQWRVEKEMLTDKLAEKINNITRLYGR